MRLIIVLLVLAAASLACNRPTAESPALQTGEPMSQEELQRLQDELAATLASSTGDVTITLTEDQINSIIVTKMAEQPDTPVTDPSVNLTNGTMQVYGKVNQAGLSLDMKMVLQPDVGANGEPNLSVTEMSLGGIPIPDQLKDQIGTLINDALREYLANQAPGFRVSSITIDESQMVVTGSTG